MELIFSLILGIFGLIPAIIITVIGFFIHPILGIGLGVFFALVAVIATVLKILVDKYNLQ